MATINIVKKFAEQAIKVERAVQQAGIARNAGRVVLVLTMANTVFGVPQKKVVDETELAKDVVSKLVGSLVRAGRLTQEREETNSRIKRLVTTDSGRDLLARVEASLQPPRPASPTDKPQPLSFDF
jgi:DNA-binding MarR family transcriptional regulator